MEDLLAGVVRENLSEYDRLLEVVAAALPGSATINPTTLNFPQWSQRDYYRVCVELIRRYSSMAVFRDGWEFSIGCQVEMTSALAEGITVCDQRMSQITPAVALAATRDSVAQYSAVGWPQPMAYECIGALSEIARRKVDFGADEMSY